MPGAAESIDYDHDYIVMQTTTIFMIRGATASLKRNGR